jgi:hypothetical protein
MGSLVTCSVGLRPGSRLARTAMPNIFFFYVPFLFFLGKVETNYFDREIAVSG